MDEKLLREALKALDIAIHAMGDNGVALPYADARQVFETRDRLDFQLDHPPLSAAA